MGARRPRSGMVGRSPTDADHVSHRSWAFAGVVSVWYEGFRRCPIEVTWRREWSHGRDHPALGMACLRGGLWGRGGRIRRVDPRAGPGGDELYLLSAAERNVKVRDGLLDIKLLREVDADGLERWEPVMKRGFPLSAAEVSRCWTPSASRRRAAGMPHPGAAPGRAGGAERCRAGGAGPQAACPLHPGRLQRRTRRPGGGRPGHAGRSRSSPRTGPP